MKNVNLFVSAAGIAAIVGLCAFAPAPRIVHTFGMPSATRTPSPQPTCGPPVNDRGTSVSIVPPHCPV